MSKTIKLFNFGIVALLLVTAFAIPTLAQATQDDPLVAECNSIYEKFLASREKKETAAAYESAKLYLSKCLSKNPDYDKYLTNWVKKYEKAKLDLDFAKANETKNIADIYKYGKQILAQEPENLDVIIKMGFAGFEAVKQKKPEFYTESATYAKMAVEKIDAGKALPSWAPLKGKEDALAYLYYTLGLVTKDSAPKDSAKYFYKVTTIEAPLKTDASTYSQIANYYKGEYLKKVEEVKKKCPEGAPDSDECKALDNDVNARLDRWADALARAISYSKNQADKSAWTKTLEDIFKQRYNKPEAVNDYVANIQKTPMPDPDSELKPAPIMEVTAATTTSTTGAITTATTTTDTTVAPTTSSTTESKATTKAAPKGKAKAAPKSTTKAAHKKGKGKRP